MSRYAADEDYYDESEQQAQGADGALTVPQFGATRKAKVRDRSGRTSVRETPVFKLRACLQCHLVLSEEQFHDNGCTNCPELELDSNKSALWTHTTANFKGLVVIMQPELSWVADYNELGHLVPGAYAISLGQN